MGLSNWEINQMKFTAKLSAAGAAALAISAAISSTATAGTAPFFVPLTSGEIVEPANSVDEQNQPWSMPFGVKQTNLTSMSEIEADINQSTVRNTSERGNVASMWDMLAYDPSGRYIFIPHETVYGAGVSRYDTENDFTEILFMGDGTGTQPGSTAFADDTDFGAFDPVRWTPNGTLIAGEEWSGTGRLVEYCNPLDSAPVDPVVTALNEGDCVNDPNAEYQVLSDMPLSAQEGISFSLDAPDEVMYFVDENRSGSIYKSIFVTPGDYSKAQTFVLKVDAFTGPATDETRDATVAGIPRVGSAQWVAITDENGDPLPGVTDPTSGPFAARAAADDVGGTPYGRPEDTTITRLGRKHGHGYGHGYGRGRHSGGNEVIYFTATSENAVYGIEETRNGPYVRLFAQGPISRADSGNIAQGDETPSNLGFPATTAEMNAPDNLAIDSLGNIYIIEDSPNTTQVGADGGDIWFARDTDNDGVAESVDHFLSLQVNQSEATGMIFNPVDGAKFVVAVQHPNSTNENLFPITEGFGDALWEFDLADVQPPKCTKPRQDWLTYNKLTRKWVNACSTQRDFNAVKQLKKSAKKDDDFPNP